MTADRFAYVDRSLESYVISCAICGGWACVRLTLRAAEEAKADHDVLVHGADSRVVRSAIHAADARRRRHAARRFH